MVFFLGEDLAEVLGFFPKNLRTTKYGKHD